MTNASTPIKIVVSLVAVAALVATRMSSSNTTKSTRSLKGSRKVQFANNIPGLPGYVAPVPMITFTGGTVTGTSNVGGTASALGEATNEDIYGVSASNAGGNFTTNAGSSGFVNTIFGAAEGSNAAGASGAELGLASNEYSIGTVEFDGTTKSSAVSTFGAGFSPVVFYTEEIEIPGMYVPGTNPSNKGSNKNGKGGKNGGGGGGGGTPGYTTPPTFETIVTPVATGITGGFGMGSGLIDILGTTTGTLNGDGDDLQFGEGSISGFATNFAGGSGSASNFFGKAGGLGSGAGAADSIAAGTTAMDTTDGMFTGTGAAGGTFTNNGSGLFGP